MMKGTYFLGLLIFAHVGYLLVVSQSKDRKPHPWARGFKAEVQPSPGNPQAGYVWNALAPLADDVSLDISRTDLSKRTTSLDSWSALPRSYLLHEARPNPGNITYSKWIYQALLFLAGALLMKLSVVPLF